MSQITIKLIYPVSKDAPISQYFGENPISYYAYGLAGHNGIDFAVPVGTPVYAVSNGTVTMADYDSTGYGCYIKIDHGAFQTLYAHLNKSYYKKGQVVPAGAIIGDSGNTGNSSGPHLHFELRIPGHNTQGYKDAVDALPFLTGKADSIQTCNTSQPPSADPASPGGNNISELPPNPRYLATVNVRKLYIRTRPAISLPSAGTLPYGITVAVYDIVYRDGNAWARLDNHLYCACTYKGSEYLILEKLP